jgi:PAS domain S-box-containing protein
MEFTGLSLEEALGDGWLQAVHPDDREMLIKGWYTKTGKEEESISEYRLIDKKGRLRWVNGKAIPIIDSEGVVTGYIGTLSDVTDAKLAMELLQKSEETLNKAQSISKIGNWEFNLITGELAWSKEQYRIFELEGHPAKTLFEAYRNKFHPDDLAKLDSLIAKAVEEAKGFVLEHRIICNDGSIKYILGIGEVVLNNDGKVIGLKGTGQDITESKKYELEILQAQQKTDTLINTVDGIVWEADARSFQFTFISKKVEEVLGYPAEQWISDNQFWADHIHPDDKSWAIDYCVT